MTPTLSSDNQPDDGWGLSIQYHSPEDELRLCGEVMGSRNRVRDSREEVRRMTIRTMTQRPIKPSITVRGISGRVF